MASFPVTALRSVDFIVPDLAAATRFYADVWGLDVAARGDGVVWLRATGSDAQVIALHAGPSSAVASTTYRVAAGADPDAIVAAMVALGGQPLGPRAAADEPGGGTVVAVRDTRGRTLRLVHGDAPVALLPFDADRPERLSHININSDDVARDTRFYTDGLGFKLTDRSKMMAFVRCNADHHAVVVSEAPVNTMNHVAFQLPTWEGVMRAAGRMVDHHFPIGWGPGRHGPGNNVFTYFVDPFGFVVEYTADVLQVDDDYRVGGPDDWTWPPGRTDQWGIAPPKTIECKAAQLAIPFA